MTLQLILHCHTTLAAQLRWFHYNSMHFIIFAPLLFKEHDPEAEWGLPLNGPWINCSSDWCKEIGFSHLFWISTFKKYFYFKKKSLEKCAEFTFFHYNVQQWSRSVFKCNNKYNKNRHFGVLTVTWIENLSFMFFFFLLLLTYTLFLVVSMALYSYIKIKDCRLKKIQQVIQTCYLKLGSMLLETLQQIAYLYPSNWCSFHAPKNL